MAVVNWPDFTRRVIALAEKQAAHNDSVQKKNTDPLYQHFVVRAYQYAEQFLDNTDLTWDELKKAVGYDAQK